MLLVCSGNICRSPIAEQVLRAELALYPQFAVSSAGTIARPGMPMPEQASRMSRLMGGDPSAHRSRRISTTDVAQADLILGMAREHRGGAVKLLPSASRRTFALLEFSRLAASIGEEGLAQLQGSDPVTRLRDLVSAAASQRGMVPPPDVPDDDDVIDPYLKDDAVYEQAVDQMGPALDTILRVVRSALTPPRFS